MISRRDKLTTTGEEEKDEENEDPHLLLNQYSKR